MIFICTLSIVSACGDVDEEQGVYPYGHYEDDEMIGNVLDVNTNDMTIEVDISEWEKRDI